MSKSPWDIGLPEHKTKETEDARAELLLILDKLRECQTFLMSDGRIDKLNVMKLSFLLAVVTAFELRRDTITDSDLKAVLQNEFDRAFQLTRQLLKTLEITK